MNEWIRQARVAAGFASYAAAAAASGGAINAARWQQLEETAVRAITRLEMGGLATALGMMPNQVAQYVRLAD